MSLSVGDKIGCYEIIEPIGAGGMGELYRARDTKLDRDVAIKVLLAALAQDSERLARFERKAKILASRTSTASNNARKLTLRGSPGGGGCILDEFADRESRLSKVAATNRVPVWRSSVFR